MVASYSLAATEPVDESCAEVTQDTPTDVASIEAVVGDGVAPEGAASTSEERTKSVGVGIPVSAQAPTPDADGGKVAAAVSDIDDELSDKAAIDSVVSVDEETPPQYPEDLGEANEDAPDAKIVGKAAMADVLLAGTEKAISPLEARVDLALLLKSRPETEPAAEAKSTVESALDMVAGTGPATAEGTELVMVPVAEVGL